MKQGPKKLIVRVSLLTYAFITDFVKLRLVTVITTVAHD